MPHFKVYSSNLVILNFKVVLDLSLVSINLKDFVLEGWKYTMIVIGNLYLDNLIFNHLKWNS